jgi:hypothetical protein
MEYQQITNIGEYFPDWIPGNMKRASCIGYKESMKRCSDRSLPRRQPQTKAAEMCGTTCAEIFGLCDAIFPV